VGIVPLSLGAIPEYSKVTSNLKFGRDYILGMKEAIPETGGELPVSIVVFKLNLFLKLVI
jgi:hypothetical protein